MYYPHSQHYALLCRPIFRAVTRTFYLYFSKSISNYPHIGPKLHLITRTAKVKLEYVKIRQNVKQNIEGLLEVGLLAKVSCQRHRPYKYLHNHSITHETKEQRSFQTNAVSNPMNNLRRVLDNRNHTGSVSNTHRPTCPD